MRRWGLTLLGCLLSAAALAGNAPAIQVHGKLEQGGLAIGTVPPGSTLTFDGKTLSLSPEGGFVIGFDRDEPAQGTLTATLPDGNKTVRKLDIQSRDWDIERINGLPDKQVNLSQAALKRIHKDAVEVWRARDHDTAITGFLLGWRWPAQGRISGVFGSQRILDGEPRRPHYGVDIAAPVGTPVVAPAPGVVRMADKLLLSGNTLIIDHGHGVSSTFLHLSKFSVQPGETVKKGEKIGEIGQTGRATGPHVDWRINWFKRRLDPQLLVPPMVQTGSSSDSTSHGDK